ncbi:hypothetical protein E3N88_15417 [Mikania micrantha]|uniref:Uncharacterized protein n=1 Tax=Mikania micrantha TaxID=192012 RepID=A0A5N6NWR1_9ASTR|nr:hypothetical protein E3N88_15417 [Mikania micrantha]
MGRDATDVGTSPQDHWATPRHHMAPWDEPQVVHEVGESSHQAELRAQMQQVSQDLQGLRQDLHQHHTTLEDTRTTVLEILTSHLTLMDQVNVMGTDTQAWRTTVEERLRRTWRQVDSDSGETALHKLESIIYQRFPYFILDDTPSDSSGSSSDAAPSQASSEASQAGPQVPATPPPPPPSPSPLPPPPASPIRVPVWDGMRRMWGQARKTTGLPPRHHMAPWDEPQVVHEVGESSHQAELRAQMQQVSQELQGLRQDLHQHHTTLEDTRTTVLEILTSHLTLMDQVNVMGTDTQAWRTTVEERLRRTWRQVLVATF